MAGYNMVCELLPFGKRTVLVPRAEPVMEQLIRARQFAERGRFDLFDLIEPAALDPNALVARVLSLLTRDPSTRPRCRLDGLPRIGERVVHLLEGRAS
jgi:predicted glycosyltransferase